MLRLVFTTSVALWVAFVIWGDPSTAPVQMARTAATTAQTATVAADYTRPTIMTQADAQPAAMVTQASTRTVGAPLIPRLVGEPIVISLVQPDPAAPVAAALQPEAAAPLPPLFTVTGNSVNLRDGPSTSNRVIGALTLGTVAEAVGAEQGGWIEIRAMDSGLTGFMSARFLSEL
jgi:uncharacterized protein YgiM (DUF1202 family)